MHSAAWARDDAGNVFADRSAGPQRKAQNGIRASSGLGISWISPMGPLRLAYALPIKYQKADEANDIAAVRLQRIQFQIGSSF